MSTFKRLYLIVIVVEIGARASDTRNTEDASIEVIDLTHPTTWRVLSDYYGAVEKNWKICMNCGIPGLGTAMHLDHSATNGAMHPAVIPSEYLLTQLVIIDVSSLVKQKPALVLTLDVALQWLVLRHDPREPTVLLFKFGWKEDFLGKLRSCVCMIPGISYDLSEWIATKLPHVVGVGTDAPTLESEETRELTSRTVSNMLGRSGVYMIENVNLKRQIPERGCLAMAMPLKLQNANYVPSRLTAFCSPHSSRQVSLALRNAGEVSKMAASRNPTSDVNLEEIMN